MWYNTNLTFFDKLNFILTSSPSSQGEFGSFQQSSLPPIPPPPPRVQPWRNSFWVPTEACTVRCWLECFANGNVVDLKQPTPLAPVTWYSFLIHLHTLRLLWVENMIWRRSGRRWRDACVVLWSGERKEVTGPRRCPWSGEFLQPQGSWSSLLHHSPPPPQSPTVENGNNYLTSRTTYNYRVVLVFFLPLHHLKVFGYILSYIHDYFFPVLIAHTSWYH